MWSSSSSHSVWTDIVCRHHCIRLESFYRTFWFYLYFFIHFLSRLSNTKLSDTMNDDKNNKTNVKKKRKKCFAIVTRRPFRHAQNPTAATHTQYRSGQVRIVWMRRGVVCSNVTNKKQSKIIVPNVLTTRVCRQLTNTDPTKIITTINMNVVGVDETQTTEKREKSFRSVFLFLSIFLGQERLSVVTVSQYGRHVFVLCSSSRWKWPKRGAICANHRAQTQTQRLRHNHEQIGMCFAPVGERGGLQSTDFPWRWYIKWYKCHTVTASRKQMLYVVTWKTHTHTHRALDGTRRQSRLFYCHSRCKWVQELHTRN